MPRVPKTIPGLRNVVDSNGEPHEFQKTEKEREAPGELKT